MTLPWTRFVALGDSMTEGVGDPRPDGRLRGWADRLAAAFATARADFGYTNLAKRGMRTREVRETQLPRALELRPDLASALVGMNDLINPRFDPARYEEDLEEIVRRLREAGAVVMTATYPDITLFSPLRPWMGGVRTRLHQASEVVRRVSERHGALMLDAERLPESRERQIVSVDRLHPGPRGHVLVARSFARALEELAGVPVPMPEDIALGGRLAQTRWLARQLTPARVGRFIRSWLPSEL